MPIEREKLFGDDLRLAIRQGLDLIPDGAGDLDLAHGNDNIVQALQLRLMVRKGELAPIGWPGYGSRLHELIGEPNIPRTHAKIMAFARVAIEADPRVEKVQDVRAVIPTGDRNVVRIEMEILLISQPNPLNFVFDVHLESL